MKKAISLMVAAMALVMMMSACTAHGTPTSLVGTWKMTEGSQVSAGYEYSMRIDDDDSVWGKYYRGENYSEWNHYADITKCTCMEMTLKDRYSSESYTSKYELSSSTLIITNDDGSVSKFERL